MQLKGTFAGYLNATFPSQIILDVTEFCNLACIHCPYVSLVKPKGKERHSLSPQLHDKMVREIKESGLTACRFVRYTGEGETLLHPQIMDFLAAMSGIGMPTTLTTNGMLLSDERCSQLIEAGTSAVDISIDAFRPETYAKIRVGGELEIVKEGVLRLIAKNKAAGGKMKIMVSFIHQDDNTGEAEPFKTYWNEKGVDLVFVRNLHSCAGLMQDTARMLWEKAPKPRTPCLYPWERLLLKADGLVDYCPSDWKHGSNVGNFAESTIVDIWQGPAMTALRQAHVANDFSCHPLCAKCPDWSTTYWPDEGRTYATAIHEQTLRTTLEQPQ